MSCRCVDNLAGQNQGDSTAQPGWEHRQDTEGKGKITWQSFSVQKSAVLGTAKILCKAPRHLRPLVEDLSLKEEQTAQGDTVYLQHPDCR